MVYDLIVYYIIYNYKLFLIYYKWVVLLIKNVDKVYIVKMY